MTTITIELCAEDRARLDAIITALQSPQDKTEAVPVEPTKDEFEPQFTHDDILKKVITLSAAGKKQEARDIVNAYAAKVSDIPADKLAEVAESLDAIGC